MNKKLQEVVSKIPDINIKKAFIKAINSKNYDVCNIIMMELKAAFPQIKEFSKTINYKQK